jgi:hypothetical protein
MELVVERGPAATGGEAIRVRLALLTLAVLLVGQNEALNIRPDRPLPHKGVEQ